ncbi:hypothetical protein SAMN05414139_01465 [Burkholderia sp. D7]|nr:hypothetical protein SAMN05414139_01465 [Burkholderia sp. D7]
MLDRKRWAQSAAIAAASGMTVLLFATASQQIALHPAWSSRTDKREFSFLGFTSVDPGTDLSGSDDVGFGRPDLEASSGSTHRMVDVAVTATINPTPLADDSDAEVTIEVSVATKNWPAHEMVRLESESFKIVPSEPRSLDLRSGSAKAQYVITPKGRGTKMLHVFATYVGPHPAVSSFEDEQVITVRVIAPSSGYLGMTSQAWTVVQGVGAALGAPSLLLLIVTRWLDGRKKKTDDNKADDTPKIILPK